MTGNSRLGPLARLGRDPHLLVRAVLGVLLAANIVVALILFKPWGASPAELEQELGRLRSQIRQRQDSVERLRKLVENSEKARDQGDTFLNEYFMDRRTASSTIISELRQAAKEAGIKQEEHTFGFEPIEGSDNLSMMTVSGNYEGTYENLVKFINLLDRSPRFLILDTLTASPERSAGALNVNFRLNAFVMEGKRPAQEEAPAAGAPADEEQAPGKESQAPDKPKPEETQPQPQERTAG